jgi:hypothetical protein
MKALLGKKLWQYELLHAAEISFLVAVAGY